MKNLLTTDSNLLSFKTSKRLVIPDKPRTYNRTLESVNMTTDKPKAKQDFSCYKQFPVRLHVRKILDKERIAKIAEMQSRGISFVDFVRNSLDKYELGGKLQ